MKKLIRKLWSAEQKLLKSETAKKWRQIIENDKNAWSRSLNAVKDGPRILIATSMGCYEHATITESILAVALTLRGAKIDVLLCDKVLPCCQMTKITNVEPMELLNKKDTPRCYACDIKGKEVFTQLKIRVYGFGDFLTKQKYDLAESISKEIQINDLNSYRYEGMAVGEHAFAGALRYYARGDLENEKYAEHLLRRYLKSSMLTVLSLQSLLNKNSYDVAVFHHGIYVPQGIIGEVCRDRNIRIVNWNPSYRKQTFIFSHDDSYHHTMITEPKHTWEKLKWTSETEKVTMKYLKSRWYGTEDWIWFHEKPIEEINSIAEDLGIDFEKPCIGMLSSVMWDAQLHYKSNAFENMKDWVFQTIEYFQKRPDLQLILRVHPAEVRGLIPSNQKLVDVINERFPSLTKNIFIIPPESHISTYAVMEKCDTVIIYNTKAGIEISCMGIPVIVAGEAWIRNKGFSIDASSPHDYFKILDRLPMADRLSDEKHLLAKKYAYHFFFRRMIELPFIISPKKHKFAMNLNKIEDLSYGNFSGLDVICEGILNGKPFIQNN